MDLYNLKKNKLEEVQRLSFDLEKDIQSLIEENVETLFNLEFVSSDIVVLCKYNKKSKKEFLCTRRIVINIYIKNPPAKGWGKVQFKVFVYS